MATSSKKLAPAASRSWLKYGLVAMAVVIGGVLSYRATMGTTIKEQKAQSAKDKEARELGSKSPGNAAAFSVGLESKRKEAEEQAAKDKAAAPNTTGVDAGLGNKLIDSGKKSASAAVPTGKPSDGMTDAQIDAYANLKEENLQAQNRKLSYWEAPTSNASQGQGGLDQLIAQFGAGQQTGSASGASGATGAAKTGADTTALLNAYLKSQGQAAPSANKDTSFVKGLETKGIASPLVAQTGSGRYSLLEGAAIPIVMRTAVSSDLPGPCRAAVEQDVYDSVTQSIKLIPAGTTAICTYNAETAIGQDRLLLAFTRLIFPNGSTVALGGMEVGDEQGKIGAKADVNTRFWSRFGSSLMIAGISVLTQGVIPMGAGTTINMPGSSSSGAGTQALGEVAKKSFERNLNIKEELRLAPGDRLRLIVTRDIVLDPAITQVRN